MLVNATRIELPSPTGCGTPAGCRWEGRYGPVAPGQTATTVFTVLFTGAGNNNTGPVDVKVVGWMTAVGEQPNIDGTNKVTVPLGP
jgi:hypothetical protein